MKDDVFDDLLAALKVLAMIKEGQKMSLRKGQLSLENATNNVLVSIKRWLNCDNRHTTLTYIRNIINISLNEPPSLELDQALEGALTGLNALLVTYTDDAHTVAIIQVLEDKIKNRKPFVTTNEHSRSAPKSVPK